jgi:hypothetical protein
MMLQTSSIPTKNKAAIIIHITLIIWESLHKNIAKKTKTNNPINKTIERSIILGIMISIIYTPPTK